MLCILLLFTCVVVVDNTGANAVVDGQQFFHGNSFTLHGDGAVIGCSDASQLLNVTRELLRRGYGEVELEKIWGANWLRVMHHVQHV